MCADIYGKGIPDEDIEKIRAASPTQPLAKPAKPRKLLVYSSAPMFYHSAIPRGVEALRIMGELTGAYSILVCDDKSVFQSEYLSIQIQQDFNFRHIHLHHMLSSVDNMSTITP